MDTRNLLLILLVFVALWTSWGTRSQAQATESSHTLQLEKLEIVNSKGQVTARLDSNANGGTLQLFRPGSDGEPESFAWIGCSFQSGAEIIVSDPTGKTKASVAMGLSGDPIGTHIYGTALNGKPVYTLNSALTSDAVLTLWKPGTDEKVFSK